MASGQLDLMHDPGRPNRGSTGFYAAVALAGIVVLVQLVFLVFPGGTARQARGEPTPTLPRPTRTRTATATVSLPTRTPSPTRTPAPPTATATPTKLPTAVPTSTPTETLVPCEAPLEARFVSDVTIPDYTNVKAGQQFDKTWRISNPGECPWPAEARLVYVSGQKMGEGTCEPLAAEVAPGGEVDLTVSMTAPSAPGTYKATWRMSTAEGELFGKTVFVIVKVPGAKPKPTATPVPAPVDVLNRVTVDNGEWGKGWIEVKYNKGPYYFNGSDGRRYLGEVGFLSRPESLAKIQDIWSWAKRGGGNWNMTVLVREQVAWISCPDTAKVCFEWHTTPTQANLTTKVFYRPEVWVSLLDSDRAGGWQAVAQNAYYYDIQKSVFEPIVGVVPEIPCVGFKFPPVE